jgi:AcrR family transcriptional regulator
MSSLKEIGPFGIQKEPAFAQDRARRTYHALLEAAAEVFVDKGFDATQTPDIAAAAGVSVGTFYRYFNDKREIFLEILRRNLNRSHNEVLSGLTPERLRGADRRATIELAMHVLIENITRSPGMQKMFLEMSLRDAQVAALKRAFDDEGRRRVTELIAAICPADQVADPEATAYMIHTAVIECALRIAGAHGQPPVPRERAVAALTELVYRALFGIEG